MSTIAVNNIIPANAGSETYFLPKAWINFNGSGTVAIRADGNVSSLTDNGVGDYSINFTNAMSDTSYGIAGFATNNDDTASECHVVSGQNTGTFNTTAARITTTESTTSSTIRGDTSFVCVQFIR